jgi:hypothetical protein
MTVSMLETSIYVVANSTATKMAMTTESRYFRTTATLLETSMVSSHSS